MKNLSKISDKNIENIIKNNRYVLIVFTSLTCGQCQLAKNNLLEVVDNFYDLSVYECMVTKNPKIREEYKISTVPTFKLFKDGEAVYTSFGIREQSDLYYQLNSFL